jgi:hypothetical protein
MKMRYRAILLTSLLATGGMLIYADSSSAWPQLDRLSASKNAPIMLVQMGGMAGGGMAGGGMAGGGMAGGGMAGGGMAGGGMGGMAGAGGMGTGGMSAAGMGGMGTNVDRTNVNRTNVNRTNINVSGSVRPWVRQPYYGTIVGGVALGTMIAATTVPVAPAPNLCWIWTSSAHTQGYWDYCTPP